jgi:hypothetical protein
MPWLQFTSILIQSLVSKCWSYSCVWSLENQIERLFLWNRNTTLQQCNFTKFLGQSSNALEIKWINQSHLERHKTCFTIRLLSDFKQSNHVIVSLHGRLAQVINCLCPSSNHAHRVLLHLCSWMITWIIDKNENEWDLLLVYWNIQSMSSYVSVSYSIHASTWPW